MEEWFPSLKDLCSLSLVNHIPTYTVDCIFSLPTVLLRHVLSLLPAVDLHLLQKEALTANTPNFTENHISRTWEDIFYRFYPNENEEEERDLDLSNELETNLKDNQCVGEAKGVKAKILDQAVNQVLQPFDYSVDNSVPLWASSCLNKEEHVGGAVDTLVCVPHIKEWVELCTRHVTVMKWYGLSVVCSHCCCVVPFRLQAPPPMNPFGVYRDQAVFLCRLLVSVFSHHPPSLSHYYHSRNIVNLLFNEEESVRAFVAGVKDLTLTCYQLFHEDEEKRQHDPREILKSILYSPRGLNLSSLSLCGLNTFLPQLDEGPSGSFIRSQLLHVSPFFAQEEGYENSKEVEDEKRGVLPYGNLLSFSVSWIDVEGNSLLKLSAIINYQKNIRNVSLKFTERTSINPLSSSASLTLCGLLPVLVKAVSRSHFASLMLVREKNTLNVSLLLFLQLLMNFLTNSSRETGQVLHVKNVRPILPAKEELSKQLLPSCVGAALDCTAKEIHLHFFEMSDDIASFLSMLPAFTLKRIEITTSFVAYECALKAWEKLHNVKAKELFIGIVGRQNNSNESVQFPIGRVLKNWLSSDHLWKLELCGISMLLFEPHLSSIVSVFSFHANAWHSLSELLLSNCSLGHGTRGSEMQSSGLEVSALFDSIFNLSQVSNEDFRLYLDDETLRYNDYLTLCSSWLSSSGSKRLLQLLHVKRPVMVPSSDYSSFKKSVEEICVTSQIQILKPLTFSR